MKTSIVVPFVLLGVLISSGRCLGKETTTNSQDQAERAPIQNIHIHFVNGGTCTIAARWEVTIRNLTSGAPPYIFSYGDSLRSGDSENTLGIVRLIAGNDYKISVTGRCESETSDHLLAEGKFNNVNAQNPPRLTLNDSVGPQPGPQPGSPSGALIRPELIPATAANHMVSDHSKDIPADVGDWIELSYQYPTSDTPEIELKNNAPDVLRLISFRTSIDAGTATAVAFYEVIKAGQARPRLTVDNVHYVYEILGYTRQF